MPDRQRTQCLDTGFQMSEEDRRPGDPLDANGRTGGWTWHAWLMIVQLIDGTYELFRQHFSPRNSSRRTGDGVEIKGVRGVLGDMMMMLEGGATHMGVATDHVIESFRNDLYPGYKTGEGMDPEVLGQFGLLERGLRAMGLVTMAMDVHEADDALGAAAAALARDDDVERILIYTADKDLAQCVVGERVVQFNRRSQQIIDFQGVIDKYGVRPESIPDWLGLVGDSADGFPGLQGWGAKSAATVLFRYGHIEQIPLAAGQWDITVRGGAKLAKTLSDHFEDALLFRRIATLDLDAPVPTEPEDYRWVGPTDDLAAVAEIVQLPELPERADRLAQARRTT